MGFVKWEGVGGRDLTNILSLQTTGGVTRKDDVVSLNSFSQSHFPYFSILKYYSNVVPNPF